MKEIKQQALNLVDKFEKFSFEDIQKGESAFSNAKQCALIAVDEILEEVGKRKNTYMGKDQYKHWELVKMEIEKL